MSTAGAHPPVEVGRPGVEQVLVVVPARDEERLVGGCLRALGTSVAHLGRVRPTCRVRVVVVLDGCRDATAAVVAAVPGVVPVEVDLGVVGAVRAAGVAAGLGSVPGAGGASTVPVPPERVWLAHTDADTRVPETWLATQLGLADRGADLVLGTVEPDPVDTDPAAAAGWWARHHPREDHTHVHGANLGVRADAYARAGGFPPVRTGEDVALARRLSENGAVVVRTDTTRVRTSGRSRGRLSGGFADHLAGLG